MSAPGEQGAKLAHTPSADFALCVQFAGSKGNLPSLGNTDKLELYSFFKQASGGPCAESGVKRPGMLDFAGRAKWDAWSGLGDLSRSDAEARYVCKVQSIVPDWKEKALVVARGKAERAQMREARDKNGGGDNNNDNDDDDEGGYDYSSDEVDGPTEPSMLGLKMSRFQLEDDGEGGDNDGGDDDDDAAPEIVRIARSGDLEALTKYVRMVKSAPGAGADPCAAIGAAADGDGLTALLTAVDRGNVACVTFLLAEKCGDPSGSDNDGTSALHYAAWCEDAVVYAALVNAGADESSKDAEGKTPREILPKSVAAKVNEALGRESS